MSSIADRQSVKSVWWPTTSRAEPVFWIALVAVAAAVIASAVVGASYGFQVPSEAFLVGP